MVAASIHQAVEDLLVFAGSWPDCKYQVEYPGTVHDHWERGPVLWHLLDILEYRQHRDCKHCLVDVKAIHVEAPTKAVNREMVVLPGPSNTEPSVAPVAVASHVPAPECALELTDAGIANIPAFSDA